jgi:DNA-binding NtrC family response regulator
MNESHENFVKEKGNEIAVFAAANGPFSIDRFFNRLQYFVLCVMYHHFKENKTLMAKFIQMPRSTLIHKLKTKMEIQPNENERAKTPDIQ